MKQCPGAFLKTAALRSIAICERGDRPQVSVPCRLLGTAHGSLILLTCSCGCASIWDAGQVETAQLFSSMYSTGRTVDAMKLVRKSSCVTLLMPFMKNSGYHKDWLGQLDYLEDRAELVAIAADYAERRLREEESEGVDTASQ